MKSLMFVPSKPKMLAKIPVSEADACIIDLEDSILEADKQQALEDACLFLNENQTKNIFVRLAGNHIEEELEKLDKFPLRGYMIPKFEDPSEYKKYNQFFRGKDVIALVETPMGLVNIREISSSPIVTMVAFGAEDFTSVIGMKNSEESINYARSVIVTYGKAFQKPVYDTPSFIIDDMDALQQEIQIAVDLGFDGKLAIHPKQVSKINDLFQYFDLGTIKKIVEQYEAAGEAILRIDDKVFEKMHIAHFKKILKEHGLN